MNIIILTLLFIFIILSFCEEHLSDTQKKVIAVIFSAVLIVVSATKDICTTSDAKTYEDLFYNNCPSWIKHQMEPSFLAISYIILKLGGSVSMLFLVYALIAIPLKIKAIWKLTPFFFTAMVVYIGVYFPLHDVVQIRTGAACAFLLLSIITCSDKKYFYTGLLWLCAVLLHYSSAAFLPVYFIGNIKINKYWKWGLGLAIPVSMVLYSLGISALSLCHFYFGNEKFEYYILSATKAGSISSFYIPYKQVNFLAEVVLFYLMLIFYDTIAQKTKYVSFILISMAFALISFLLFADVPIFGARFHELFAMTSIVGFTYSIFVLKHGWIAKVGICAFALLFYLIQMKDGAYFF